MATLTAEDVLELRWHLRALGYGRDAVWAEGIAFPETPEELAERYAFVVVNSGMKATVARGIFDRLWPAVLAGRPARSEFGHPGKALAIDLGWILRRVWWKVARELQGDALVAWCQTRPWVGPITKYHLAINLGADVCKPDRWLVRLAEGHRETCAALCQRLARDTGLRVATVDVLLWRGCAEGVILPAPDGFSWA